MGNTNQKSEKTSEEHDLKIYQQLISMGFDDELSWKASAKYKNIDDCIQFISNITKKKTISKQIYNIDQSMTNNTTKCLNNININIAMPTEHQSCDISNCLSVKRICSIMALYSKQESVETIINSNLNENNGIIKTLNDYIHIIENHNDDNNFEDIYNTLNINCNLNKCISLQRNQRDRMNTNNNNNDNKIVMDIFDKIHCYLCHTFDTGYRLNKSERNLLQKEIKRNNNDNNNNNINIGFIKVGKMVHEKRKKFNDTFDRKTYSKFVTTTDKNQDDTKDNETKQDTEKTESLITYNFSHRFNYWQKNRKLSVLPKYKSLKEELTSSKNIVCVELNEWNDTQNKSMICIETNYAKKLKAKKITDSDYGITVASPISIKNLMVIIFYTDYDLLSFKFSETFRTKNDKETLKDVIKKNANYYWFSRFLRETVELYGNWYRNNSKVRYFHGISCLMIFKSYATKFNHPTSTTKQLIVAQHFATNSGIIIEIGSYTNLPCFQCSWISSFANEDETLFIGGFGTLKIENIINCANGEEYKIYLHAMAQLAHCINNWRSVEATKQDTEILDLLCFKNDSPLIPKYCRNTFKSFTNSIKIININITHIQKQQNESSYFLSLLLSSKDLHHTFVNMRNISQIFRNVEQIIFTNTYHLKVSTAYFQTVSLLLTKYKLPSLKQIIIKDCSKEEHIWLQINDRKKISSIDTLIDSINDKFTKKTKFNLESALKNIYITKNYALKYKLAVKKIKSKHGNYFGTQTEIIYTKEEKEKFCFDGNGMVLMANGTYKKIYKLKVGDKVISFPNGISTIKCRVISNVNKQIEMVNLNKYNTDRNDNCWITFEHPVLINIKNNINQYNNLNTLDSKEINKYGLLWVLPTEISQIEWRYQHKIYNFVLDSYHTMKVNGHFCCTLGHDYKGSGIQHDFWGNSIAMNALLQSQPDYPNVNF